MSRGHDEHDVLWRYSLGKIDLYCRAAQERGDEELMDKVAVQHAPKAVMERVQGRRRRRRAEQGIPVQGAQRLRAQARERGKHGQ